VPLFKYTESLDDNRMIENNLDHSRRQWQTMRAAAHFESASDRTRFLEVISDADIRGNLGLLFAHEGKTTEAVEQLNEALRLNPNSAEAHTTLGVVLLRSGKAEESIPHFSIAIRLRPDWAVARENLKRAEEQIHMRR
jgi:Flp pilus assembly protein TadD